MFWSKDVRGLDFFSPWEMSPNQIQRNFQCPILRLATPYSNLTADVLHYRAQVVPKCVFLPGPVGIWSNNFYCLLTQILFVCVIHLQNGTVFKTDVNSNWV